MTKETTHKLINTYKEYEKKMRDYTDHIVKMMIGKKDQPIPLHAMIVSGDKGVGKTYTAEQILSKQKIRGYQIVTGSLSAVQLYKFLWEHNDEIIVLDDVNSILQDSKDGASLLKACTETRHKRLLHWQKQNYLCIPVNRYTLNDNDSISRKMEEIVNSSDNKKLMQKHSEGRTFPDQFYFTGALIILTNKPLSVIDRVTEGAVSNRGWHQEMLFSVEGAVDLLKNSVSKMTTFNDTPIKVTNVKKALNFLTSKDAIAYYRNEGKIPTLRTLGKIASEIENGIKPDMDMIINNTESPAY
jgi:hypothetical protein